MSSKIVCLKRPLGPSTLMGRYCFKHILGATTLNGIFCFANWAVKKNFIAIYDVIISTTLWNAHPIQQPEG